MLASVIIGSSESKIVTYFWIIGFSDGVCVKLNANGLLDSNELISILS